MNPVADTRPAPAPPTLPRSLGSIGECLLQYESEHRALIEETPDLVARFDGERRFVYVNPGMADALGQPPQFFLGRRPSELPGQEISMAAWDEQIVQVARVGREAAFEFEWTVRAGEDKRIFEARLIPERRASGQRGSVLAVARDVTDHRAAAQLARETETYHRALIADSSDLLAALDTDGKVRFCSDSATHLLGHYPEDLTGMSVFTLVHPDDLAQVTATFADTIRSPNERRHVESRIRHADGSWRLFEVLGKSLTLGFRERCVILNARDITERRRLETLIHRSQRVTALGRMAGGIAHEFNNLLTSILGTCEILSQDLPDHPELATSVDVIRNAGRSAEALTHQLFALGHRQPPSSSRCDIDELFREIHPLLSRLLGADVTVDMHAEPGDAVDMDRGLVEQVIVNLACNARVRVAAGGHLTITSRTLAEGCGTRSGHTGRLADRSVRITLSNAGVTMDAASLDQITDPFLSEDSASGIEAVALAAVYSILEQGGGTLRPVPGPGPSNDLWVDLPAATVVVDEPSTGATAPVLGNSAGWESFAGSETILVVEDDPDVLDVTTRFLQRLGYHVLRATEPCSALAFVEAHPGDVDLVLSDVNLPGMSGPAMVARITALRPSLRVIYASGYLGAAGNDEVMLPAGSHFLQKPYSLGSMGQAIRNRLNGAVRITESTLGSFVPTP